VREAEGRRNVTVRLRVGADEWRDFVLFAIPDYHDIRINQIRPVSGAWPPPSHALLIERAAMSFAKTAVGQRVLIELPDGKRRELPVAGIAHDLSQPPSFFVGKGYGYITFATLEWLGLPPTYNELYITVAEHEYDKAAIQHVADLVRNKIEKSGRQVFWSRVPTPGKHPVDQIVQAVMVLLGVLGVLALLLSGFLVINTIGALLAQQVRQIGVMKAIGACASQVRMLYLSIVLIFGLLSLVVALPLGALGAGGLSSFTAHLLNFDITSYSISPSVLALQLAVSLVVPLLAALWPIRHGTHVTVLEAISLYRLDKRHIGRSWLDRLLEHGCGMSPPLRLALRNIFRRVDRLVLTLLTLTLGGALFIAVLSVRASASLTLDDAFKYWNYDVMVSFNRSYRTDQVEQAARGVPGVVRAESWGQHSTRLVRADKSESDNITLIGLPAATDMLQPTLLQGRWLITGDENAIVVNTDVLKDTPGIGVGDILVFTIDDRETTWQVVGIVKGVLAGRLAYANFPYFAHIVHDVGRAGRVQVVTERHDPMFEQQIAEALEARFQRIGLRVDSTQTTADQRTRAESQFNILIVLLMIMAVLLAAVGGLGLMGTMSINVLDRTREIGVLRAIGASNSVIFRIVMAEGILIGMLSWLTGVLLAYPISKFLSDASGMSFTQAPFTYTFSPLGALFWLMLVIVLAGLASTLPAWNASRLTVRDVLAYE
jgi:putative ABC transport system permease protein